MRRSRVIHVEVQPREPGAASIEEVYRARLGQFRRVATAVLGDPVAAQDAVQDGFVRALRDRASYRGIGPLDAWVWGCVMNEVRTSARNRRPPAGSSSSEPVTEPGSGSDADEDLRRLIRGLPERQRLALFLRYFADLDYESIAAVLGIAPGTVAASLHSAHAAIRKAVEGAGP
jgi:RNA polymerase sigma factor (sigma-70 family)